MVRGRSGVRFSPLAQVSGLPRSQRAALWYRGSVPPIGSEEVTVLDGVSKVYTIVYMTYQAKETTKVSKWGNSLGVRLSARSAARAGISSDTILTVESGEDVVILRKVRERKRPRTLKELLKHVRPLRKKEAAQWIGMEPVGKEIW